MSANDERLLRIKDVKSYIPFSTAKIYALMEKNQFPKKIKVGGSSVWRLSDIQNYVAEISQKV